MSRVYTNIRTDGYGVYVHNSICFSFVVSNLCKNCSLFSLLSGRDYKSTEMFLLFLDIHCIFIPYYRI